MGQYLKFMSKMQLEPNLFEITYHVFDNGACQCHRDCDCYKRKGQFIGETKRYSNGLVRFSPEKEARTYNTIEGCKASLAAYLSKRQI